MYCLHVVPAGSYTYKYICTEMIYLQSRLHAEHKERKDARAGTGFVLVWERRGEHETVRKRKRQTEVSGEQRRHGWHAWEGTEAGMHREREGWKPRLEGGREGGREGGETTFNPKVLRSHTHASLQPFHQVQPVC
mmetsp:Transcript_26805/g.52626  ORF Transcript_26805/g.52626 Transcript_26805/m.52626 type:complete len:135 (+) Transcript_26805:1-405(+)